MACTSASHQGAIENLSLPTPSRELLVKMNTQPRNCDFPYRWSVINATHYIHNNTNRKSSVATAGLFFRISQSFLKSGKAHKEAELNSWWVKVRSVFSQQKCRSCNASVRLLFTYLFLEVNHLVKQYRKCNVGLRKKKSFIGYSKSSVDYIWSSAIPLHRIIH